MPLSKLNKTKSSLERSQASLFVNKRDSISRGRSKSKGSVHTGWDINGHRVDNPRRKKIAIGTHLLPKTEILKSRKIPKKHEFLKKGSHSRSKSRSFSRPMSKLSKQQDSFWNQEPVNVGDGSFQQNEEEEVNPNLYSPTSKLYHEILSKRNSNRTSGTKKLHFLSQSNRSDDIADKMIDGFQENYRVLYQKDVVSNPSERDQIINEMESNMLNSAYKRKMLEQSYIRAHCKPKKIKKVKAPGPECKICQNLIKSGLSTKQAHKCSEREKSLGRRFK